MRSPSGWLLSEPVKASRSFPSKPEHPPSYLLSDVSLKPYTNTAYHNEELKSLTRNRFRKVKERAKLKSSVSRLVCILFPELEKLAPTLLLCYTFFEPSIYDLTIHFRG